jgi:hypothetical protein
MAEASSVGPPSSWIVDDTVYCSEANAACSEQPSGTVVGQAPSGINRHLDCEWVDSGYSTSLGVDKHECVALHGVLLGTSAFAPNGEGWGTQHPATIFNGGDPSGLVTKINWQHWGGGVAIGWGRNAIFKPHGGYYPQLVPIELRASRPSVCGPGGPRIYTRLEGREPMSPHGPLGKWFLWSGFHSLCHGFGG